MLIFLKLGGSLITDKTRPYTPHLEKLDNLAAQIAAGLRQNEDLRLVLGHGSGSFGHQSASRFGTRNGVNRSEAWHGFAEVWYQASSLNRIVIEALRRAGLPAITLAPISAVMAENGCVADWNLTPLKTALVKGLLPVIHGDVTFDTAMGGTILSTEDLFVHLSHHLHPDRILLAGLEAGVWKDFPTRNDLITDLTPGEYKQPGSDIARNLAKGMGPGSGVDVTGGMHAKVAEMLSLVEKQPDLEVLIFSGEGKDNLRRVLSGENLGTRLHR